MTEIIRAPYVLPDLRPFRSFLIKPRIQGCAVVAENGCISSEDPDGWHLGGDGTITGFGDLDADLEQLQIDLDAAEAAINLLETVTIPALQAELDVTQGELDAAEAAVVAAQAEVDAAEAAIATLNTVTIPALDTRLDTAESEINTAQADLDAAEASIATLNTTTIPALDTRLDQAELDVAAAQAEVDAILPIETADVSPGAITAPLLAANSVIAGKIAARTIVAADIATNTITAAELAAGSVTADEIAAGAVTAGKIAAGTIVAADIAGDTITANQLAADSVTASEIAANAVTTNELAAGAVTAGKIAAGTIVAADIASGTITSTQIAAGTITASDIAGDTITANELAADSVTASEIAALTITSAEIAAGTITADKLQANTLTANEIGANAITANELAALNIGVGKFIASTSYVPGVSGWQIDADGSAEFNDGTFRGEIDAAAININVSEADDGSIEFYDVADRLVGSLSPLEWSVGDLFTPGARVTLDPTGALRIRDENDVLVAIVDQQGVTLRNPDTGQVSAELQHGSLRIVDPGGHDDIEMVTSTASTMPNAAYRSAVEAAPGTSAVVPAPGTVGKYDLALLHTGAFRRGTVQANTWTPPAGTTEVTDVTYSPAGSTLASSLAVRSPAANTAATFTASAATWGHAITTSIVVKGAGSVPSVRASSNANITTTATGASISIPTPTGTLDGDVMVIFVALGNSGGGPPTGWTVPPGWTFLGANVGITGTGSTQSTTAVGAWSKMAAGEGATQDTKVTFGPGTKTLTATCVSIQNPQLIAGGVQIRMAGRPIRRLLDKKVLETESNFLAVFSNIPASYDHLEIVWSGASGAVVSSGQNIMLRLNVDTGASSYRWQLNRDGGVLTDLADTFIILGGINGAVPGHEVGGEATIYDAHAEAKQCRLVMADSMHIVAGNIVGDSVRAMWNNTTDAIHTIHVQSTLTACKFAVGSSCYLYGY